jgi:hypothetical protein
MAGAEISRPGASWRVRLAMPEVNSHDRGKTRWQRVFDSAEEKAHGKGPDRPQASNLRTDPKPSTWS